jgi:hypothetical protein
MSTTFDDYREPFPKLVLHGRRRRYGDPIAHQRCGTALVHRRPNRACAVRVSSASIQAIALERYQAEAGHLPFGKSLKIGTETFGPSVVRFGAVTNRVDTMSDSRIIRATNTNAFDIISIIKN